MNKTFHWPQISCMLLVAGKFLIFRKPFPSQLQKTFNVPHMLQEFKEHDILKQHQYLLVDNDLDEV